MPHSPLSTPSATRAVLESHGLILRKSLGQHFLVDDNVIGRILALAALPPEAIVLEVGPGIGTLTAALCQVARAVVAVEQDAALLPALDAVSGRCGNLTVVNADAVKVPIAALTTPAGPPAWFVANLPYGVAATVMLRFLEEVGTLRAAVVMVQSEVADRMVASPGGKDYGAYTVKLRLRAVPAGRFAVARTCFLPPPRVDSSVVRFDRIEDGPPHEVVAAADAIAAAAFAQRRKTLRNSVLRTTGWSAGAFDDALSAAGIDGGRRAETLEVAEYVRLAVQAREQGLLPVVPHNERYSRT